MTEKQGPHLELKFTFRAYPSWIPGSIDLYETVRLPAGTTSLDAAALCVELVDELRARIKRSVSE